MIYGIGVDTVAINRFATWATNERKLTRFFHDIDLSYLSSLSNAHRARALAGRFAAKEAFGKAMGCGLRGLSLNNIAVSRDAYGSPKLELLGNARRLVEKLNGYRGHLSISYTDNYATAYVIVEEIQ